jgi:hypothetical protein
VSALWPLQTALMTRLKGDPTVSGLVGGRIFDGMAPPTATMPYIVTGEPTEEERGTLGRMGYDQTLTVHVWSRYQGRMQALQIITAMNNALRTPLSLGGHTSTGLRQDFTTVLVEDDGVRHGYVRYRLFVMENA